MVTYKTIVVPTDGSENAKRALEHALAVADRNHAELIVVHVANIVSAISNFDQTPISGGYVSEQIAEDMEETGKEILNDVVKEIPTGVKVKSVFEVGSQFSSRQNCADSQCAVLQIGITVHDFARVHRKQRRNVKINCIAFPMINQRVRSFRLI